LNGRTLGKSRVIFLLHHVIGVLEHADRSSLFPGTRKRVGILADWTMSRGTVTPRVSNHSRKRRSWAGRSHRDAGGIGSQNRSLMGR
jgi:hypothetical protein